MIKTIDDYDLKGKRVLLRVDLNSSIVNNNLKISDRFVEHAKTIKLLKKKKAQIVILAHQSRPGKKDFTSLKKHANALNKYVKVKYVDDIIGKKAISSIIKLKNGEALLLDNVRKLDDEFKPSVNNKLVKKLYPLIDLYVNDAFSISHRRQTSVVSFPQILHCAAGPVMIKEIEQINSISKKKPIVYIIGGRKVDEVFYLVNSNIKKVDYILCAGFFAMLCLIAKGNKLGKNNKILYDEGYTKYIPKLKKLVKSKKIILPDDFAIIDNKKRKEILIKDLPVDYEIFDIGKKTIEKYTKILKKAKTILVKGPLGHYEDKRSSLGTEKIFKTIEKSKAYSLFAGGHTITAMKKFKLKKSLNKSLAGGAFAEYLAGKKLPGIEVLKNA